MKDYKAVTSVKYGGSKITFEVEFETEEEQKEFVKEVKERKGFCNFYTDLSTYAKIAVL